MASNDVTLTIGANLGPAQRQLQAFIQQSQRQLGSQSFQFRLDEKGFRQPLGRITGDLNQFQGAMDASIARTLAFGASVGAIAGVTKAFKDLVAVSIKVEHSLKEINVLLNLSTRDLQGFSKELFSVAKNTASSFDTVTKAATEFSRQGLGAAETAKRVNAALILTRLSGLDAEASVSALTAAVNGFRREAISTTEVVNRLANVDAAFAVSSADLAKALSRAGSVSQDAKVKFNELLAATTAVQQATARGGNVIGNGFKTIFTRLQRSKVRSELEKIGVATTDATGNIRGAIDVLKDYAKVYQTLSDQQKAYTSEQVAGVFQINTLKALINDLSNEYGVYNRALAVANNTTNEAVQRNAELNKTLQSLASQTGTEIAELAAKVGAISFEGNFKGILGFLKSALGDVNKTIDSEGIGGTLARGILQGFGDFITGPGMAVALVGITRLLYFIGKQTKAAVGQVFQIGTESQKRQVVQQRINALLAEDNMLLQQIMSSSGNINDIQRIVVRNIHQQNAALANQKLLVNQIAAGFQLTKSGGIAAIGGATNGPSTSSADGFVPNMVRGERASIRQGVGGARGGDRPVVIPNFSFGGGKSGTMVAHTGEYVVPNFASGGSAIFNREMVSSMGLPSGARRVAAKGFVPNFAQKEKDLVYSIENPSDGDSITADVRIRRDVGNRLAQVDAAEKWQTFGSEAKKLISGYYTADIGGKQRLQNTLTGGTAAFSRLEFKDDDVARGLVREGFGVPDYRYTDKGTYLDELRDARGRPDKDGKTTRRARGMWKQDAEGKELYPDHPKKLMVERALGLLKKKEEVTYFKGARKKYDPHGELKKKAAGGFIPNFVQYPDPRDPKGKKISGGMLKLLRKREEISDDDFNASMGSVPGKDEATAIYKTNQIAALVSNRMAAKEGFEFATGTKDAVKFWAAGTKSLSANGPQQVEQIIAPGIYKAADEVFRRMTNQEPAGGITSIPDGLKKMAGSVFEAAAQKVIHTTQFKGNQNLDIPSLGENSKFLLDKVFNTESLTAMNAAEIKLGYNKALMQDVATKIIRSKRVSKGKGGPIDPAKYHAAGGFIPSFANLAGISSSSAGKRAMATERALTGSARMGYDSRVGYGVFNNSQGSLGNAVSKHLNSGDSARSLASAGEAAQAAVAAAAAGFVPTFLLPDPRQNLRAGYKGPTTNVFGAPVVKIDPASAKQAGKDLGDGVKKGGKQTENGLMKVMAISYVAQTAAAMMAQSFAKREDYESKRAAEAITSGMQGATTGATIGSMIPIPGGAAIGGVIGLLAALSPLLDKTGEALKKLQFEINKTAEEYAKGQSLMSRYMKALLQYKDEKDPAKRAALSKEMAAAIAEMAPVMGSEVGEALIIAGKGDVTGAKAIEAKALADMERKAAKQARQQAQLQVETTQQPGRKWFEHGLGTLIDNPFYEKRTGGSRLEKAPDMLNYAGKGLNSLVTDEWMYRSDKRKGESEGLTGEALTSRIAELAKGREDEYDRQMLAGPARDRFGIDRGNISRDATTLDSEGRFRDVYTPYGNGAGQPRHGKLGGYDFDRAQYEQQEGMINAKAWAVGIGQGLAIEGGPIERMEGETDEDVFARAKELESVGKAFSLAASGTVAGLNQLRMLGIGKEAPTIGSLTKQMGLEEKDLPDFLQGKGDVKLTDAAEQFTDQNMRELAQILGTTADLIGRASVQEFDPEVIRRKLLEAMTKAAEAFQQKIKDMKLTPQQLFGGVVSAEKRNVMVNAAAAKYQDSLGKIRKTAVGDFGVRGSTGYDTGKQTKADKVAEIEREAIKRGEEVALDKQKVKFLADIFKAVGDAKEESPEKDELVKIREQLALNKSAEDILNDKTLNVQGAALDQLKDQVVALNEIGNAATRQNEILTLNGLRQEALLEETRRQKVKAAIATGAKSVLKDAHLTRAANDAVARFGGSGQRGEAWGGTIQRQEGVLKAMEILLKSYEGFNSPEFIKDFKDGVMTPMSESLFLQGKTTTAAPHLIEKVLEATGKDKFEGADDFLDSTIPYLEALFNQVSQQTPLESLPGIQALFKDSGINVESWGPQLTALLDGLTTVQGTRGENNQLKIYEAAMAEATKKATAARDREALTGADRMGINQQLTVANLENQKRMQAERVKRSADILQRGRIVEEGGLPQARKEMEAELIAEISQVPGLSDEYKEGLKGEDLSSLLTTYEEVLKSQTDGATLIQDTLTEVIKNGGKVELNTVALGTLTEALATLPDQIKEALEGLDINSDDNGEPNAATAAAAAAAAAGAAATAAAAAADAAGNSDPGAGTGGGGTGGFTARGYIPSMAQGGAAQAMGRERRAIRNRVGGAIPGVDMARMVNLNGSPAAVNSGEKLVNDYNGTGQTAVLNRDMQARGFYGGYIPNFAGYMDQYRNRNRQGGGGAIPPVNSIDMTPLSQRRRPGGARGGTGQTFASPPPFESPEDVGAPAPGHRTKFGKASVIQQMGERLSTPGRVGTGRVVGGARSLLGGAAKISPWVEGAAVAKGLLEKDYPMKAWRGATTKWSRTPYTDPTAALGELDRKSSERLAQGLDLTGREDMLIHGVAQEDHPGGGGYFGNPWKENRAGGYMPNYADGVVEKFYNPLTGQVEYKKSNRPVGASKTDHPGQSLGAAPRQTLGFPKSDILGKASKTVGDTQSLLEQVRATHERYKVEDEERKRLNIERMVSRIVAQEEAIKNREDARNRSIGERVGKRVAHYREFQEKRKAVRRGESVEGYAVKGPFGTTEASGALTPRFQMKGMKGPTMPEDFWKRYNSKTLTEEDKRWYKERYLQRMPDPDPFDTDWTYPGGDPTRPMEQNIPERKVPLNILADLKERDTLPGFDSSGKGFKAKDLPGYHFTQEDFEATKKGWGIDAAKKKQYTEMMDQRRANFGALMDRSPGGIVGPGESAYAKNERRIAESMVDGKVKPGSDLAKEQAKATPGGRGRFQSGFNDPTKRFGLGARSRRFQSGFNRAEGYIPNLSLGSPLVSSMNASNHYLNFAEGFAPAAAASAPAPTSLGGGQTPGETLITQAKASQEKHNVNVNIEVYGNLSQDQVDKVQANGSDMATVLEELVNGGL